jgi:hypothetical protein
MDTTQEQRPLFVPQQLIPQYQPQQYPPQVPSVSRPSTQNPQAPGKPVHITSNNVPVAYAGSVPSKQGIPPVSNTTTFPSTSSPAGHNIMAASAALQAQSNPTLAQQAQLQNATKAAAQAQQPAPGSPSQAQAAAREKARVTVLLEINTQLLQEVVSLQAQGKAGTNPNQGQQSPTSPTSATDPSSNLTNSPGEPPKSAGGTSQAKPPSQEYAECMRRLQANLSYLAAIADAKKKTNGALPAGPAIMTPPPHLPPMAELYQKLNGLFPEAAQSVVNKAIAQAQSQSMVGVASQMAMTQPAAQG